MTRMNMETAQEKYRQQLIQHVQKYHFLKRKSRLNWEMGCWLGKEPTGKLFTIKYLGTEKLNEHIKQLADDMWDYLFTEKGEQIIKAEYEKRERKAYWGEKHK